MKVRAVPILRNISEKNLEVGNRIGRLMIQVFIDAKSLSLSAYSWPSRVVAGFHFNKPYLPYEASAFDLQYVNPSFHRELLHTIVQAHVPTFINEIEASLAGSFRCDASMDRTQKDNEFQLMKVIDKSGNESTKFLGIGYVTSPGALGHLKALKDGAEDTIGFERILRIVTHLSTDGENKNVGEHKGLWKLIDEERVKLGHDNKPLLKSVCAVHSSALAYKDLCKSVPEIKYIVESLTGMSTYFHTSARRSTDLSEIAKESNLTCLHFPTLHEVRWSQFTASLLHAVLSS